MPFKIRVGKLRLNKIKIIVPGQQQAASFALVQSKAYGSTAAAATHDIVLNGAPTEGNLILLAVCSDATVNTPAGYAVALDPVDSTGTYLYYKFAGAGESATITVTPSSSATTSIIALEYSGIGASPLDRTAQTTGQSASVSTGTTAATTQNDELLIGIAGYSSNSAAAVTGWSNSFVEITTAVSTSGGINPRITVASRQVSATSTYSSVASLAGATSAGSGGIATFKISNP